MTNFIYNMQDELFHLNMILPVGEFSPIVKLVDHIEAQGKQLRELNAAVTKRNETIEKYERDKKDLQERNILLVKKVQELNEGVYNSEDLNTIINSKNKLLDEYMIKCNNLEHNYKEEVRMKEQFKTICFRHEETIRKLKRDNNILSGKVKEAGNLAETILMLCDDEE